MRIPFVNNDDLDATANRFLLKHHPGGTFPVPIEEILDVQMHIDIIPVENLRNRFDIDAYTSCDLTSIYIDARDYYGQTNRFRFSLAHEAAHIILHRDFIATKQCATVGDWKSAVAALSDDQYIRLEHQANVVAGGIMAPRKLLIARYRLHEAQLRKAYPALHSWELRGQIEANLSRDFRISTEAIHRRCEYIEIEIAA